MRQTLDFLLNEWLEVAALTRRPRFADHSAETFSQVLDACEKIARDKFAPFNRLADTQEPHFDGERVHLPAATAEAVRAYAESGMLAAAQDHEFGGMQLPCVVEMAANAFFSKASVAMGGYAMLTSGPRTRHHVPERAAGRLVAVGRGHARAAPRHPRLPAADGDRRGRPLRAGARRAHRHGRAAPLWPELRLFAGRPGA